MKTEKEKVVSTDKYPARLFAAGFIMSLLFRHAYLTAPAVILLIIGIWVSPCLIAGAALLMISLVVSLVGELSIKKTFETESENVSLEQFKKAVTGSDGGMTGVRRFVEENAKEVISDDNGYTAQRLCADCAVRFFGRLAKFTAGLLAQVKGNLVNMTEKMQARCVQSL